MKRKKSKVRGSWGELIFFCLMLGGFYFVLALLNFPLVGERGLSCGEYLRSRWGGAVIVIFLFWIYLCFARLMRVRVPRITAQILGTLMLYFALNFIFGLVRHAGLDARLAIFTPSYTGLSLAGFFVLNFGAPGAIIAAVIFLLIAAFLFRSHVIFAVMPHVFNFVDKINEKFNYYEEEEESNNKRLTRRERILEEAQEKERERLEREEQEERELEEQEELEELEELERLERENLERARKLERKKLEQEAKASEVKDKDFEDKEPESKSSELKELEAEQERVKKLESEERTRREARLKELRELKEQEALNESKNEIERRIENKIKSIENLLNYKNESDVQAKQPQDILGDLLSSLESGAFAVPDKLLKPIDDDIRPEVKRGVSSDDLDLQNENVEDEEEYIKDEEDFEIKDLEVPEEIINQGLIIIETLKNFGVNASIAHIIIGSSVIQFQLELARGVKVDRLPRFANDLAMALAVMSVRIEAPIPGKRFVGIEIPNLNPKIIELNDALNSQEFKDKSAKLELPLLLGADIESHYLISGLEYMTHLVIAGAAASGKSVFINNCIMSMCSNNSPESLKLILIDPKRVDFAIYDGLPHLIAAPVADSQKASEALLWAVNEMERRVKLFADLKVRNLAAYNFKIEQGERLARIVIIIDEPGDLLYISSAENNSQRGADELIDLLIRKAGPAGIHLIIATQRPSINLIANIIKTNIAARAAFKLTSQTESRLFAGVSGAEKLQGRGDMLYISPASQYPVRLQTLNSNEKNILEFIALMRKKI
ncbi:MAG: hypothetical protein II948_09730 [Synergistaceae bacterium]|nr:hypothetical protein [Synergistaceae bacterium]